MASLGALLFGLGLYVSILRQWTRRIIGHDASPVDAMHRAVRAHANTAEFAPFLRCCSCGMAPASRPPG